MFFLFPTRRILLPPAESAARVEPMPCPLRPRSPPREALAALAARPSSAGRPRLEGWEREGQPGLRQHVLADPPAGPVQTRRLLFYMLFILGLRRGGLLPGTAHTSAPAAPKAATRGGQRQRGRRGAGGAERPGTERQHKAEKSSQSWCKGQRQKLCYLLTPNHHQNTACYFLNYGAQEHRTNSPSLLWCSSCLSLLWRWCSVKSTFSKGEPQPSFLTHYSAKGSTINLRKVTTLSLRWWLLIVQLWDVTV